MHLLTNSPVHCPKRENSRREYGVSDENLGNVRAYLLIFILFVLSANAAWAQTELLSDGAYGTTIHGGLEAKEKRVYFLKAKEGQVLKAQVRTRDRNEVEIGLELSDREGNSVLNGLDRSSNLSSLDVVLPSTDRYTLTVRGGTGNCGYVLELSLDDPEVEKDVEPWFPFKNEAPAPSP